MTSKVYVLSILYDEPDPRTYQGIRLVERGSEEEHLFTSGSPHKDYLDALSYYKGDTYLLVSSSVDQFLMDGGDLSSHPEFLTDKETVFLFTGEPIMHNGNHDPVENALYDKERIKAVSNADRVGLVKDRIEKGLIPMPETGSNLRDAMSIEDAIEIEQQARLLGLS